MKTFEIISIINNCKYDSFKFIIISNPHGKDSNLLGSGIEIKKIREIIENKFGKENEELHKFNLDKNENYDKENEGNNIHAIRIFSKKVL